MALSDRKFFEIGVGSPISPILITYKVYEVCLFNKLFLYFFYERIRTSYEYVCSNLLRLG